ncbi:MAG: ion channel, partial [Martelella sp.]
IATGAGLIALVGLLHHYALYSLGRALPRPDTNSTLAIQSTFVGLLLLHIGEILILAAANRWLLGWGGLGAPASAPLSWVDLVYLTGVNFTTLGYTQIELAGNIRIVTMLQSLGGFMILTWSATYLFTVCQKSWQRAENE